MNKSDQAKVAKEIDVDRCLDAMLIVIKERDRAIQLLRDIFNDADNSNLDETHVAKISVVLYNHDIKKTLNKEYTSAKSHARI